MAAREEPGGTPAPAAGPLLEVTDLSIYFQTPGGEVCAVRELSFAMMPCEIVGLVGESGSGKTVTGLALLGLLPARTARVTGHVRLSGRELVGASDRTLSGLRGSARISLIASVLATAVAVVIGVPLGILAGYFQGWTDALLMRITDTLLSFPAIVLAVAVTAALGPGLVHAMIAVGVVFSPTLARLARGQVLVARQRLFVSAAHTYGASSLRVMRRHILPNILQPLIVQAAFMMGLALLAEAALSFLGLGVQPPAASWGSMLQESFQFIAQAPAHLYPPGLAIALTVLAFNALGDSLRDVLDPSGVTSRTLRPGRPGRGRAAVGAADLVPVTPAFTPANPADSA